MMRRRSTRTSKSSELAPNSSAVTSWSASSVKISHLSWSARRALSCEVWHRRVLSSWWTISQLSTMAMSVLSMTMSPYPILTAQEWRFVWKKSNLSQSTSAKSTGLVTKRIRSHRHFRRTSKSIHRSSRSISSKTSRSSFSRQEGRQMSS